MESNKTMSRLYKSAYRFLSCAGIISEELDAIYDRYTDYQKLPVLCNEVIDKIFLDNKENRSMKQGNIRKLFTEAYTADGYINDTTSFCPQNKVWVVKGKSSNLTSTLLSHISSHAITMGYDVDCIYHPLHPEKLQHLYIADLNTLIISSNGQQDINFHEMIPLESLTDESKLVSYQPEIEKNKLLYDLLIKNALEKLAATKKEHSLLEVYYVSSMNFKGVDDYLKSVLENL